MLFISLATNVAEVSLWRASQRSDIVFFIYKLACIIGAESDLAIGFEKNNII